MNVKFNLTALTFAAVLIATFNGGEVQAQRGFSKSSNNRSSSFQGGSKNSRSGNSYSKSSSNGGRSWSNNKSMGSNYNQRSNTKRTNNYGSNYGSNLSQKYKQTRNSASPSKTNSNARTVTKYNGQNQKYWGGQKHGSKSTLPHFTPTKQKTQKLIPTKGKIKSPIQAPVKGFPKTPAQAPVKGFPNKPIFPTHPKPGTGKPFPHKGPVKPLPHKGPVKPFPHQGHPKPFPHTWPNKPFPKFPPKPHHGTVPGCRPPVIIVDPYCPPITHCPPCVINVCRPVTRPATVITQPVIVEVPVEAPIPAPVEAVAAEPELQLIVGAENTLAAAGLGEIAGTAGMEINGIGVPLTVVQWNNEQLVLEVPALGLSQPTRTVLFLFDSNQQPIAEVPVELLTQPMAEQLATNSP